MKHKHAELIKAWADGAIIQYRTTEDNWEYCVDNMPYWCDSVEYRIKPEPKPDVVRYLGVDRWSGCDKSHSEITCGENIYGHWDFQLKLTFDGETGKLKKAEVL